MFALCRTYVNGTEVVSPVQLHHGDRILWGNNHFFRCVFEPGSAASYFSHQHLLHVVTKCFSFALRHVLFVRLALSSVRINTRAQDQPAQAKGAKGGRGWGGCRDDKVFEQRLSGGRRAGCVQRRVEREELRLRVRPGRGHDERRVEQRWVRVTQGRMLFQTVTFKS